MLSFVGFPVSCGPCHEAMTVLFTEVNPPSQAKHGLMCMLVAAVIYGNYTLQTFHFAAFGRTVVPALIVTVRHCCIVKLSTSTCVLLEIIKRKCHEKTIRCVRALASDHGQ